MAPHSQRRALVHARRTLRLRRTSWRRSARCEQCKAGLGRLCARAPDRPLLRRAGEPSGAGHGPARPSVDERLLAQASAGQRAPRLATLPSHLLSHHLPGLLVHPQLPGSTVQLAERVPSSAAGTLRGCCPLLNAAGRVGAVRDPRLPVAAGLPGLLPWQTQRASAALAPLARLLHPARTV